MVTKAELESANRQLKRDLRAAEENIQALKKGVIKKVHELKEDNSWCDDGVNDALEELGVITPVPLAVKFTLTEHLVVDRDYLDSEGADGIVAQILGYGTFNKGWVHIDGYGSYNMPSLEETGVDEIRFDDNRNTSFSVEVEEEAS